MLIDGRGFPLSLFLLTIAATVRCGYGCAEAAPGSGISGGQGHGAGGNGSGASRPDCSMLARCRVSSFFSSARNSPARKNIFLWQDSRLPIRKKCGEYGGELLVDEN
jgi:hypothetical protein